MTITVVVVDDQQLLRAGIRGLLDHTDDIKVVGEAGDGAEAVRVVRELMPDVALMDVRMPVADGVIATGQITSDPALSAVRVIMLTTFELDKYVFEALRAGASGFLGKDTDPAVLCGAIRSVAAGESLLSPVATQQLIAEFVNPATASLDAGRLDVLTEREREVMTQVARGLTNKEIGDTLFMSPATARTHMNRAMVKLGVHDRAQLVVIAYQTGLVTPG